MNPTATAARPVNEQSCHWYHPDGRACYEVKRASGDGMRPTTLADARKLGLLPSVTTILQVLAKPQLTTWLVEQAVLAAMTTPRPPEEPLDAFIERVLHTEKVQDQESDIAKKRGTEIHDAIEQWFNTRQLDGEICQWVQPVITFLEDYGKVVSAESTVVSRDGYAGRVDLIQEGNGSRYRGYRVWDFKTTKKLPKKDAWTEHKLQLSAYANALNETSPVTPTITTGNIYISTVEPGRFVVCEHSENWVETYEEGFQPLLKHWMWSTGYHP